MAHRQYDGGQSSKHVYGPSQVQRARNPADHYRGPYASDYISRPRYPSSDYIKPRPQAQAKRHPSTRYSAYQDDHSTGSEYIDSSTDPSSDYISSQSPRWERHADYVSGYNDGSNTRLSRSRSPVQYTASRGFSSTNYNLPSEEKSNCQYTKETGWDYRYDPTLDRNSNTWEDNEFQEANEAPANYRQVNTQSTYTSGEEHHEDLNRRGMRSSSRESNRDGSIFGDEDTYVEGSDVVSCHGSTYSDRKSHVSSSADSDFVSASSMRGDSEDGNLSVSYQDDTRSISGSIRRGSDHEPNKGYSSASYQTNSRLASESVRSESDYDSSDNRRLRHSSDDNGIAEGSDYMSSDDDRSDIAYGDDNGIAEGSDYLSSDGGRSDIAFNVGSDGSGDDGDYMSSDQEEATEKTGKKMPVNNAPLCR